jgi:hypothetical protein
VSAQRCHDTEILRPLAARVADLLLTVPITPEKGADIPFTETFYGLHHLALKREPPHLAVRQYREAGLFLLGDRSVYGPVLDALVGWSGDLPSPVGAPAPPTAAEHAQQSVFSEYAIEIGRDTLENWQSEFLQLLWQVVGLAYFLYVGYLPRRKMMADSKPISTSCYA